MLKIKLRLLVSSSFCLSSSIRPYKAKCKLVIVYLSVYVCWPVGLSAILNKNYWADFLKTWMDYCLLVFWIWIERQESGVFFWLLLLLLLLLTLQHCTFCYSDQAIGLTGEEMWLILFYMRWQGLWKNTSLTSFLYHSCDRHSKSNAYSSLKKELL